jgi:selenocysteine lyase/cysteine desulfurase
LKQDSSIAQAIGLGAAVDYIEKYIDFHALQRMKLSFRKMVQGLRALDYITFVGSTDYNSHR